MPDICCLDVARRTSHVARRTSHRATRAVPQGRAAAHAVHVTAGRALLGFSSCAVGGNSGDLRRDPRQRVDREKPVRRHNTAVRFCSERCGPRSMQGRRRNSPPPTWRHRMPVFRKGTKDAVSTRPSEKRRRMAGGSSDAEPEPLEDSAGKCDRCVPRETIRKHRVRVPAWHHASDARRWFTGSGC